jgi:hypothetical protein
MDCPEVRYYWKKVLDLCGRKERHCCGLHGFKYFCTIYSASWHLPINGFLALI